MSQVRICVISAGRPENVARYDFDPWWYIPIKQIEAYKKAGAKYIVGVEGKLPMKSKQLNLALEHGFSERSLVATIDDDIVKAICKYTKKPLDLRTCIEDIAALLNKSPYYLAGPYSGLNTSWAPGLAYCGRIPGAMMVHKPSSLRFDSTTDSAEDLDYVIQHHVKFKGVVLAGNVCLQNEWSDNKGGFQDFRSQTLLTKVTKALDRKWSCKGCTFKLDSNRKNGVNYRVPWKKLCQ